MDLIYRQELARSLATQAPEQYSGLVAHIISTAPTIEAEPKHGRWIRNKDNGADMLHCSVCGGGIVLVHYKKAVGYYGYKFCPYCGSRMDEATP